MLRRAISARPWLTATSLNVQHRAPASRRFLPLVSAYHQRLCRSFSTDPEQQKFEQVTRSFRAQRFPDFIHSWGRGPFAYLGCAMSAGAGYAVFIGHSPIWVVPVLGYWYRGYYDMKSEDSILANFPVLGWVRYICQNLRAEIQQYFIESDTSGTPFNNLQRSTVYQRSKNLNDTSAFGTQKNVYDDGYEYVAHSMWPKVVKEKAMRFTIGSQSCRQPYSASRLNISAMSYGALSSNAILALSKGAAHGNFYHNTGEGAISDWHLLGGADLVWNIGTGYFGCRTEDGNFCEKKFAEKAALPNVAMLEVKLSQGAKPAHGGMLPASKITDEIARIRGVPFGQDVHSPPTHKAFGNPVELMHFMAKLREISGKPVGFKICVGCPTEMLALIRAAHETGLPPDFITIDGGEGGTGAAPKEFSDSVGLPLRGALALVHDALVGAGLKGRVTLIASGKIASGMDMVRAFAVGADVCNSARAFLFSLGCIQALQCNTNKCPTGITTQNPHLVQGLVVEEKWKRAFLFQKNTIKNMAELVGAVGCDSPSNMRREKLFRRVSQIDRQSYLDIYPREVPGSLLDGTAGKVLQKHWDDGGDLLKYFAGAEGNMDADLDGDGHMDSYFNTPPQFDIAPKPTA